MKMTASVAPVVAVAVALIVCAESAPAAEQRNVLLLISDDHGLQLGAYGDRIARTPHLDALAAEGTRFTYAFATVSSCSASRSVLQTGLFNHTNGQFGHQHSHHDQTTHRWVKSVSKILAESDSNYFTGKIGKHHVQPDDVYPYEFRGAGAPRSRSRVPGNRDVEWMAGQAGEFFGAEPERPFFLLIGYSDPHRAGQGFANRPDYPGVESVKFDPAKVIVPPWLPDWPETRAHLAEYYESVARLDEGIGMVLKELKDSGRLDSTLIIYLSDNGPAFLGAKTNLYEPGIRLPLIVRSPNQESLGRASDAMVSWIDIVPTILDWAGVDPKPVLEYDLPGRSVLPVLDSTSAAGWDEVYASHVFHEVQMYYPMRVIRTRRHKLIWNIAYPLPFPFASDLYASPTWRRVLEREETQVGARSVADFLHRAEWELYDLEADPDEIHNLAGAPNHADLLSGLQIRLKAFQESTRDPWLTKYEYE